MEEEVHILHLRKIRVGADGEIEVLDFDPVGVERRLAEQIIQVHGDGFLLFMFFLGFARRR